MSSFPLISYKLTKTNIKEKDIDYTIQFSNDISYPLIKYGYIHFILQNMLKIKEYTKQYANIKKIYLVVEPFQITIDPLNEDTTTILEETNKFIKKINKDIPNISSPNFMKMWEIYKTFDIISNDKNFKSIHLTDNNECFFVEPTIIYREMVKSKNKDDYIILSFEKIKNDFINYFKDKISFEVKSKTQADLITIELNTIDEYDVLNEQTAIPLLINLIFNALPMQNDKGNMVIKIYETFTSVTINLIEFLKIYYGKVSIYKPYTSERVTSERFLICENFNKTKISNKLNEILSLLEENKLYKVFRLFGIMDIDKTNEDEYLKMNKELLIVKNDGINNIIKFIKLDNKNGQEFYNYLNIQHEATKFWIKTFLK
jgi:23S rRNA U2552 (ribose-2'-O)-methylase RlmE/FtsJ